jgi:regulator of sigma E protease
LLPGDKITAINGKTVVRFEELTSTEVILGNTDLTVMRGNQTLHVKVPGNLINDLSDMGIDQFISRIPRLKFAVDTVVPHSYANVAGLLKGDSITAVNGVKIQFFDQLQSELKKYADKKATLEIKRHDVVSQVITDVNKEGALGFKDGRTGIGTKFIEPAQKKLTFGFFGSLPIGATKAWGTFTDNAKGLGKVFKGEVKFNKAVSGPVAIATMFGSHIDWIRFWSLVGFLSMVLALTNLLPIPALDGGHALFLIIEMIKGKPLSDKFLERAQIVGFVILITLMVFVFGNDIVKQIVKK